MLGVVAVLVWCINAGVHITVAEGSRIDVQYKVHDEPGEWDGYGDGNCPHGDEGEECRKEEGLAREEDERRIAVAAAEAAAAKAADGKWKGLFLGCFADDQRDRDLPHIRPMSDQGFPTVSRCVEKCRSSGFKYVGYQWTFNGPDGSWKCFCGDAFGKHGYYSSSQDLLPNTPEECGCDVAYKGPDRNCVYSVSQCSDANCIAQRKSRIIERLHVARYKTPRYIGCFSDRSYDRALPEQKTSSDRRIPQNRVWCARQCRGWNYFGRQYKQECFCGLLWANVIRHGMTSGCQCDLEKYGQNIGGDKNCVYGYQEVCPEDLSATHWSYQKKCGYLDVLNSALT